MPRVKSLSDENSKRKSVINNPWRSIIRAVFSRENLLALAIALALIAIYIATAADSPLWVYQGF